MDKMEMRDNKYILKVDNEEYLVSQEIGFKSLFIKDHVCDEASNRSVIEIPKITMPILIKIL